jgi:hypothetical protein
MGDFWETLRNYEVDVGWREGGPDLRRYRRIHRLRLFPPPGAMSTRRSYGRLAIALLTLYEHRPASGLE